MKPAGRGAIAVRSHATVGVGYELLKADQKLQENLPEVIGYFRDKKDSDPSSVEARTHQAILKLCQELAVKRWPL